MPWAFFFFFTLDLSSPARGELGLAADLDYRRCCAGGVIFQNSLLRPLAGDVGVKP